MLNVTLATRSCGRKIYHSGRSTSKDSIENNRNRFLKFLDECELEKDWKKWKTKTKKRSERQKRIFEVSRRKSRKHTQAIATDGIRWMWSQEGRFPGCRLERRSLKAKRQLTRDRLAKVSWNERSCYHIASKFTLQDFRKDLACE